MCEWIGGLEFVLAVIDEGEKERRKRRKRREALSLFYVKPLLETCCCCIEIFPKYGKDLFLFYVIIGKTPFLLFVKEGGVGQHQERTVAQHAQQHHHQQQNE